MQPSDIAPRDRLIVALDLPGVAAAEAMIARLGDSVTFYKIGYQLAYAGGLPLVRQLADKGKKVFIDLSARHRQHCGARCREHRQIRRDIPDRACLSADHEGRGRGARRFGLEDPRRHRVDLL
jgi:hypothetical protein